MAAKDDELRRGYQSLKLELESTNESGIEEYLAQNAPFIGPSLEIVIQCSFCRAAEVFVPFRKLSLPDLFPDRQRAGVVP
jgi:hypothetical protein